MSADPPESEPRRLLIIDDEPVFRTGLRAVLQPYTQQIAIVGEADTVEHAMQLVVDLVPDLVLIDLRIPQKRQQTSNLHWRHGVEAIGAIVRVSPHCKILVLSGHEEPDVLMEALKAGAHGYVAKGDSYAGQELREALLRIDSGEAIYGPAVAEQIRQIQIYGKPHRPLVDQLTDREREVLDLLVAKKSNAEIAAQLVISLKTVKTHVSNILAKLQIASRHEIPHLRDDDPSKSSS